MSENNKNRMGQHTWTLASRHFLFSATSEISWFVRLALVFLLCFLILLLGGIYEKYNFEIVSNCTKQSHVYVSFIPGKISILKKNLSTTAKKSTYHEIISTPYTFYSVYVSN